MRGGDVIELEVLTGARRGERLRADDGSVLLGRASEAALRLDPTGDLEVSGRHALVIRDGGGWWVRDLDSRNGTFVGGERVRGGRRLRDGDRLRLGPGGPEIVVRLGGARATLPAQGSTAPTLHSPGETPSGVVRRLGRENRRLRRGLATGAVVVVLAGVVAAVAWQRSRADWRTERAALLARGDSLLDRSRTAVEALEGELGGLRDALQASRTEVEGLQTAVRAAADRGDDDAELRERLQAATVALTRQQLAASLDFADIERRNRRALAMLFVELEPGVVSTATAFGVLPDGTLATSRHALDGPGGRAPIRVGVQYADSRQVWRGRVLAVSDEWDLALIKVDDIVGSTPVLHGLNARLDTLAAGTPVALLGFPLAGRSQAPDPLVSAGVVRDWGPGAVRVQGYGAEGASGSPVLDAGAHLVAIVYGGTGEGPDRTLLAVPASGLTALLDAAGARRAGALRSP